MAKIMGDTETWRSRWMIDALRLRTKTIQTITQATTDYDRLASALGSTSGDKTDENLSILR